MSMICFLLPACAHFSLFQGACLMPCVGKLQINKTGKKNVSCWLMTPLSKKMRVTSTGSCTLDFNLIHFPPATRARIICFNVERSEKRSLTAFRDGKWLDETAVLASAAHHKMKTGRWNGSWKWFLWVGLWQWWPILLWNILTPDLLRARHGHSVITEK